MIEKFLFKMKSYFKTQIQEIKQTPGLPLFCFFMALSHVYTFIFWYRNDFLVRTLGSQNTEPLCFPFYPQCHLFRFSSETLLNGILFIYLALALGACFCFLRKKWISLGYGLFLALLFYKVGLQFSSYNFMGNYHYMAYFITLVLLFAPHKKLLCKFFVIGFYISAGFLKIQLEWLSGATLISPTFVTGQWLKWALIYVVFLELFFVLGLLSRHRTLRFFALFQLGAFHIFSWHIVGFYYPMIMSSILSLFIIDEYLFLKNKTTPPPHLKLFFTGKQKSPVYWGVVFLMLLQIFPWFWTQTPSLSGALRLSSLNMFDAKVQCKTLIIGHRPLQNIHLPSFNKRRGVRLQCDPLVFLNQIQQLCQKNEKQQEWTSISFSIVSRRFTQKNFKPVLFLKNACKKKHLLWAEFYKWGLFS